MPAPWSALDVCHVVDHGARHTGHLAVKYQVAGVPRTVINDVTHIEGVVPPDLVLQAIQETLSAAPGSEPLEFTGTDITEA
jgi:predicted DsbA family dithiol-disulfide isomerase